MSSMLKKVSVAFFLLTFITLGASLVLITHPSTYEFNLNGDLVWLSSETVVKWIAVIGSISFGLGIATLAIHSIYE